MVMSEKTLVDSDGGSGGLKAKLAARFKKRSEDTPDKGKKVYLQRRYPVCVV